MKRSIRKTVLMFLMGTILITSSAQAQRFSSQFEVPDCDSTPLEWCSWVTSVICLAISTAACREDVSQGIPSDMTTQTFAGSYSYVTMANDTVSIPSNSGFGNYHIVMYHSECISSYVFSDFKYNGSKVNLANWSFDTHHNDWGQATFRDSSCTEPFTMATGQNISFYREFSWAHPLTGVQTTSNFLSPDTLDFSVELVRVSDGARLALLDSMGVLKRNVAGTPTLYGSNPIMANVSYTIPSSLNGTLAYVRITPKHRGSGIYKFARHDRGGFLLSSKPGTSEGQSYINTYGGGMGKRNIDANELTGWNTSKVSSVSMSAAPNPSAGKVTLAYRLTEGKGEVSFAVYDNTGSIIPVEAQSISHDPNNGVMVFNFEKSGGYYIVGYMNGEIQAVERVIVNR